MLTRNLFLTSFAKVRLLIRAIEVPCRRPCQNNEESLQENSVSYDDCNDYRAQTSATWHLADILRIKCRGRDGQRTGGSFGLIESLLCCCSRWVESGQCSSIITLEDILLHQAVVCKDVGAVPLAKVRKDGRVEDRGEMMHLQAHVDISQHRSYVPAALAGDLKGTEVSIPHVKPTCDVEEVQARNIRASIRGHVKPRVSDSVGISHVIVSIGCQRIDKIPEPHH